MIRHHTPQTHIVYNKYSNCAILGLKPLKSNKIVNNIPFLGVLRMNTIWVHTARLTIRLWRSLKTVISPHGLTIVWKGIDKPARFEIRAGLEEYLEETRDEA